MADVNTVINEARAYVATTVDGADDAIDRMREDINNVGFTLVSFSGANLPDSPAIPAALVAPTLSPVNLDLPAEPDANLAFQDISAIEVGTSPTLTAVAPTINLPSTPSQVAEFTQTIPNITTDFDFPDPPAILSNPMVAAPVLTDHGVPLKPTIALPSFDAVAPVDNITAPGDLAGDFNAAYRDVYPGMVATLEAGMDSALLRFNPKYHTQLAAIEAQLTTYMEGGSGIPTAIENAIYERAKSKDMAEARRTGRAAIEAAASNGFTIPPGAATAGMHLARQAAADNLARSANEIAIKANDVLRDNLRFAVTTSASMRQWALSASLAYHGNLIQINGQALDYAKSILGAMVQVYNLSLEAYKARMDAYRAEAQVYDTRVKAAMSYVELYKAEIDALQALTNVDRAKVDMYRSQIDAVNAYAQFYRTQVQTVVEQASLEKLKVDLFRTNVEAYIATVQGKKAEYDGYSAALNGEEAKVRIYSAQVNAYSAELSGFKTSIEAQSEVIRAQALTNQARATQNKAKLDSYSTVVQARGEKARLELDVQRAELNAFDSQVKATIATVSLQADVYKAKSQIILENTKLEVETLIKNASMNIERARTVAELGISSAKVYEGMAGAALSGMNTLVAQTLAE